MNQRLFPRYQARVVDPDGASTRKLALYRKPDAARAQEFILDLIEEIDSGSHVVLEPWAD